MARLTASEIAGFAQQAGFSGAALAWAVAVALAESGGNPRAYNGTGADESYGLWQINMKGALGPERRRKYGLTSNDQLFDPATNARVAYAISSQGQNWHAWTTYTSGKAAAQLGTARTAVTTPVATDSADIISTTNVADISGLDSLKKIGSVVTSLEFWRRASFAMIGLAVVIVGLVLLLREPLEKVVTSASPVGTLTKGLVK